MTIRGFANSPSVPPLPSFPERDPDVISANPSLGAWAPVTAVPRRARACFFLHVIGLPLFTIKGGFPPCSRRNDFITDRFFETAAISLCSGPQVCSPPRSFLPLRLIAAGQPRLLCPSRTCFVASACIGPANHPIPGNWWCGDLHPTRFTALSAAPVKPRFKDNYRAGCKVKVSLSDIAHAFCGSRNLRRRKA